MSGWRQELLNKQNDAVTRFAWQRSPCIVPWAAVNGSAVGAISVTGHGSVRSWIPAVAVRARLREIPVTQSVICYVSFLHAWGVRYSRELKELEKPVCWERARLGRATGSSLGEMGGATWRHASGTRKAQAVYMRAPSALRWRGCPGAACGDKRGPKKEAQKPPY